MSIGPFSDYDPKDAALSAAKETIVQLSRYKKAIDNHLCRYDAADWLGCVGGHGDYCDVCEAPGSDHPHKTLANLEKEVGRLAAELVTAMSTISRLETELRARPE